MIPINDVSPRLSKTIVIYAPKRLGATATVWLHEIARKLEEYNWPVDCWQIGFIFSFGFNFLFLISLEMYSYTWSFKD